jgi:hypothetical protein
MGYVQHNAAAVTGDRLLSSSAYGMQESFTAQNVQVILAGERHANAAQL